MSWIQVDQVCTITDADPASFKVVLTVTNAYGIDKELFVVRLDDDTYQYVATSKDLTAYPTSKAKAQSLNTLFYRTDKADVSFTTENQALRFLAQTHTRLKSVVKAVNATSGETFGGVDTFVYDSEDA